MEISIQLTDEEREQLEKGFPVVWYFGDPQPSSKVTVQFTTVGK